MGGSQLRSRNSVACSWGFNKVAGGTDMLRMCFLNPFSYLDLIQCHLDSLLGKPLEVYVN